MVGGSQTMSKRCEQHLREAAEVAVDVYGDISLVAARAFFQRASFYLLVLLFLEIESDNRVFDSFGIRPALGEDSTGVKNMPSNRPDALVIDDAHHKSLECSEKALSIRVHRLGKSHPLTVQCYLQLAFIAEHQLLPAQAIPCYEELIFQFLSLNPQWDEQQRKRNAGDEPENGVVSGEKVLPANFGEQETTFAGLLEKELLILQTRPLKCALVDIILVDYPFYLRKNEETTVRNIFKQLDATAAAMTPASAPTTFFYVV